MSVTSNNSQASTGALPQWYTSQCALANGSAYQAVLIDGNTLQLQHLDGNILGKLTVSPESPCNVLFYEGKGGPSLVVSPSNQPHLKLFILPGGSLSWGTTQISLNGQQLKTNPYKQPSHPRTEAPQSLTQQAMILGAGLATRFEPVSGEQTGYAKPSTPLSGDKSVIRCILEALKPHGFKQLFINTYFKAASLKASLEKDHDFEIHYIDEAAPSGTAGALRKLLEAKAPEAQPALQAFQANQAILIVQGDAVTDVDFSSLLQAHQESGAALTIGCQTVRDEEVHQFGIIETDRSHPDGVSGKITRFMEKPPLSEAGSNRLASTGFYVISPSVYPLVLQAYQNRLNSGKDDVLDFAQDVFPVVMAAAHAGQITLCAQQVSGYWSDIGNPIQYLETLHDLFGNKVNLPIPSPTEDYFQQGVVLWPGAASLIKALGLRLQGNVIAAIPHV